MANADKILTIGMAVYDDFNGVYFTIKALQLYHAEPLKRCKITVVDNNPTSLEGKAVQEFLKKLDLPDIQYIPYTERTGTSAPREEVILSADTPWVMVCDPHIVLHPGSLDYLLNFLESNNPTNALISGALMSEDGKRGWLNMHPKWRGALFGIWADAISVEDLDKMEPMEISATGLGLFVCYRDFWPGFHPQHKGFGGEEFYIHEKYRRRGGYCLSLPKVRYSHRFGYSFRGSTPYPDKWYYRIRNYVLEFQELGWDISEIRDYYIGHGYITPQDWQYLISNPAAHDEPPSPIIIDKDKWNPANFVSQQNQAPQIQQPQPQPQQQYETHLQATQKLADEISEIKDLTEIANRYSPQKRKVDFPVDLGNDIIVVSANVLDLPLQILLNAKRDSSVILLSTNVFELPIIHALSEIVGGHIDLRFQANRLLEIYKPTAQINTLALDLKGQDESLLSFLEKFASSTEKIILYNGEENEELENKISIKLLEKFPDFSVHDKSEKLFIVFDRTLPKKELPSLVSNIVRYSKSVLKRVTGESVRVSDEEAKRRLSICSKCEYRNGLRCTICGCYLVEGLMGDGKVFWSEEKCPKDKW